MLEGVLKDGINDGSSATLLCFNPWYVGGGVKSGKSRLRTYCPMSFNPWYVGGGVKSKKEEPVTYLLHVSILGMLEGVLKVY